jgi:hypothetical protein
MFSFSFELLADVIGGFTETLSTERYWCGLALGRPPANATVDRHTHPAFSVVTWAASLGRHMRAHLSPRLPVWGLHDVFSLSPGAESNQRDVNDAEAHQLDASHFALEIHQQRLQRRCSMCSVPQALHLRCGNRDKLPGPFCPTRFPKQGPLSRRCKSACPGEVCNEFGLGLSIERDPGRLAGSAAPGLA